MNSHKAAISQIRESIKKLSEEKPAMRAKVLGLKFDEAGKRRPETGPERYKLRQKYTTGTQCELRAHYIAYALLRGRPYSSQEITCHEKPATHWVAAIIVRAFGDDTEARAAWTDKRVRSLIEEGKDIVVEAPPQAPPVPVKPASESKGLLSFITRIFA